eukprot:GHVQ01033699.1.p1 GENE.GHVQ01033699.1~~GHVQ01033699.1.p1  ORF type:complete len:419 (-),score=62.86 GHVQ01033699.1:1299-2555(-)
MLRTHIFRYCCIAITVLCLSCFFPYHNLILTLLLQLPLLLLLLLLLLLVLPPPPAPQQTCTSVRRACMVGERDGTRLSHSKDLAVKVIDLVGHYEAKQGEEQTKAYAAQHKDWPLPGVLHAELSHLHRLRGCQYIVGMLGAWRTPSKVYIVFPRCSMDLGLLQCCITQDMIKESMKALVTAVRYVHNSRVSHRDIKTENVLVEYKSEDECPVGKYKHILECLRTLQLKKANTAYHKAMLEGYADKWDEETSLTGDKAHRDFIQPTRLERIKAARQAAADYATATATGRTSATTNTATPTSTSTATASAGNPHSDDRIYSRLSLSSSPSSSPHLSSQNSSTSILTEAQLSFNCRLVRGLRKDKLSDDENRNNNNNDNSNMGSSGASSSPLPAWYPSLSYQLCDFGMACHYSPSEAPMTY